jgi:excinuclease UvrABC nuclease subunit
MWQLPKKPGVYLFLDLRGTLYVGQTTDLQRRYEEHWVKKENEVLEKLLRSSIGTLRFLWFEVEGYQDRDQLERSMIRLLNPPANRIKYRLHSTH